MTIEMKPWQKDIFNRLDKHLKNGGKISFYPPRRPGKSIFMQSEELQKKYFEALKKLRST